MQIKRLYNLIIDKDPAHADGKLRFRVKWNNNKSIIAFNIGYRINVEKWSKESSRCINNTTHGARKTPAAVINKKIQVYIDAADEVFRKFESLCTIPSKDEVKFQISELVGRKVVRESVDESMLDVFDKFVADMGRQNTWTKATYQKFAALRVKIQEFKAEDFDTFDEDGLNGFVYFLRESYDMRNSTIEKQLGFLGWFFRWAVSKGYSEQTAFQKFAPKLKKAEKRIVFLNWDELMTVYNFNFSENDSRLSAVRDVFCFCCFTSLRYSDVANLQRSDIYDDHIELTSIKTADSLRIELNKYSRAILEKYAGETFKKNLALPVISNQKMNEALKEIGRLCEIDTPVRDTYYKGNERFDDIYPKYELLSTHAGRRTFICNALTLGIAPSVVMKWTGHSDYKAMKPYIDIADQEKKLAMNLFNK